MPLYLPIAGLSLDLTLLLAMGLAVGVLAGLFGIGGGFILTPLLIFLGVPPAVAVGTGAAQVVASSVSGALSHWSRGNVDVKMGAVLIAGGFAGSAFGVGLQQLLKAIGQLELFIAAVYVIMLGVIGALMLIESVRAIRGMRAGSPVSARRGGQHGALQKLPLKMRFRTSKLYASALPPLGIGAFVGLLTAIMGVGGGFVLIPALIYILRLPTRLAMGTSAFQIIFVTSVTTVLQATQNHSVDAVLAAPLIAGGVVGAQIGVRAGQRLAAEQLRLLLALLVLGVAVRIAVDLVTPPRDPYAIEAGAATP
jgi:uncharacterized membrane protein YfcA